MSRIHLVLVLFGLSACPKPMTPGEEPAEEPAVVPSGAVEPASATPEPASAPPTAAGCLSHDDCDGGICEGLGCGDDQPGTCAAPDRMCTRDSRPYCGCDGQTFRGSGSCPGRRYAAKGECSASGPATPEPAGVPGGAACLSHDDCDGGICEGEGCGEGSPGTCKAASRACTRDHRPYCGCDGQTFHGSGSCPGQRFAHRGECTSGA